MKKENEVKLFEIEGKWLHLDSLLEQSEGEITEEIESFLQEIQHDLKNNMNIDAYAYVLKMLKTNHEVSENSKKVYYETFCRKYETKAKSYKKNYDTLRERIQVVMDLLGVDVLEGEQNKIKLVNTKESLTVKDYSQEELAKIKSLIPELVDVTYSINKDKVTEYIKKKKLPSDVDAYLTKNKYVRVF